MAASAPLAAPPSFTTVKSIAADMLPRITAPKSWLPGVTASVAGLSANVAVTVLAASRVTTQAPVPLQPPPDHDVRSLCGPGVAVKVTVSTDRLAAQVAPQLIPAG